MKYIELNLIRGYDLFFYPVSAKSLENMGIQLGERSSFDAEEFRVTRMNDRIARYEPKNMHIVYELVDCIGLMFALTYGCKYDYCEIYVTKRRCGISEA